MLKETNMNTNSGGVSRTSSMRSAATSPGRGTVSFNPTPLTAPLENRSLSGTWGKSVRISSTVSKLKGGMASSINHNCSSKNNNASPPETARSEATKLEKRRMQYKLSAEDITLISGLWSEHVGEITDMIGSTDQLIAMMHAMRIQVYDAILNFFTDKFKDNIHGGRVSYVQFCRLFEESKEFHDDYLESNPHVKDDLLDAFIAVGGSQDTTGFMDVETMQSLMRDFKLGVDVQKIVEEVDQDGNMLVDFDEFTDLLKGNDSLQAPSEAKKKGPEGQGLTLTESVNVMIDDMPGAATLSEIHRYPIELPSTMRGGGGGGAKSSGVTDQMLARLQSIQRGGSGGGHSGTRRGGGKPHHHFQNNIRAPTKAPEFYRRVLNAVGDTTDMGQLREKIGLMMKKADRTGIAKIYTKQEIDEQRLKRAEQTRVSTHLHSTLKRRQDTTPARKERIMPSATAIPIASRDFLLSPEFDYAPRQVDLELNAAELRDTSSSSSRSSRSATPFATSSDDGDDDGDAPPPTNFDRSGLMAQSVKRDSSVFVASSGSASKFTPTKPPGVPTRLKAVASSSVPGIVMSLPASTSALPTQTFVAKSISSQEEEQYRCFKDRQKPQEKSSLITLADVEKLEKIEKGTQALIYSSGGRTRSWELERRNKGAQVEASKLNGVARRKICNADDYGLKRREHDTRLYEQYLGVPSVTESSEEPNMSFSSDRVQLNREQQARVMLKMHSISKTDQLMLVHDLHRKTNTPRAALPAWKGRVQDRLQRGRSRTKSPAMGHGKAKGGDKAELAFKRPSVMQREAESKSARAIGSTITKPAGRRGTAKPGELGFPINESCRSD